MKPRGKKNDIKKRTGRARTLVQMLRHQGSDVACKGCGEEGPGKSLWAGPQPFYVQDSLLACNRPHPFQEMLAA